MNDGTELSSSECLRLLTQKSVGRIAFATENGLRIFPVNYVLRDRSIILRTTAYGVIARSIRGAEVAFQVDELDEQLRQGWSVLAVGHCERLEDAAVLHEVRQTQAPDPWVGGTRELYFSIGWQGLSGRRLGTPGRV